MRRLGMTSESPPIRRPASRATPRRQSSATDTAPLRRDGRGRLLPDQAVIPPPIMKAAVYEAVNDIKGRVGRAMMRRAPGRLERQQH